MPRKENMFEGERNLGRFVKKGVAQKVVDFALSVSVLAGTGFVIAEAGRAAEQECIRRGVLTDFKGHGPNYSTREAGCMLFVRLEGVHRQNGK